MDGEDEWRWDVRGCITHWQLSRPMSLQKALDGIITIIFLASCLESSHYPVAAVTNSEHISSFHSHDVPMREVMVSSCHKG